MINKKNCFYILAVGVLLTVLVVMLASCSVREEGTGALVTYTEQVLVPDGEVERLVISLDDHDVEIEYGDEFSIKYPEMKTLFDKPVNRITVTEQAGTLTLRERMTWYGQLIAFNTPKVTVTLKRGAPCDLSLDADNADVIVRGAEQSALGDLSLEVDNGDVILYDTFAKRIDVELDNGAVTLARVYAQETIFTGIDNGNIRLEDAVVAKTLSFEIDNGSVASDCDVDADRIGIEIDNGDIRLSLLGGRADYAVTLKHDNGDSNIARSTVGDRSLALELDNGDIFIYFSEEQSAEAAGK